MRVLHCIPTMLAGGAERQLCYLAEGLVARGHEVHVALFTEGPNSERLRVSGAVVDVLRTRHAFHPRHTVELGRRMRALRPEVVQTWFTVMDFHSGPIARVLGIPWVVSERTTAPEVATAGLLRERTRRLLIRGASGIVANSEAGCAYWRDRVGDRVPVEMIENALPLREIRTTQPASRSVLGVPSDAEVVLFAGRFVDEKNLPLLAATARVLLRQRPRAWLIACGDGPRLATFERDIGSIRPRVRMLGFRSDVWAIMKAADALVSTSYTEGQPNSVLEAMACGCPVVLSDIRQHRAIAPAEGALFFGRDSPDDAARALSLTLTDPMSAQARAEVAEARMAERSIAALAEHYERFYRRLVETRAG